MRPDEVIVAFADHLLLAVAALRANVVGASREAAQQPLTFETGSGERVRSATLDGVGTASLHGIGCRIDFLSGAEVDFDWDSDRREVFDGWRLRAFALSVGQMASIEELVGVARADRRFVEVRPGWFALELLTQPA